MNMTAITYFKKVAELMSFTKAADALYVSQQSVSLQIKHLEESYHVQLFERKPSLKLTEAGRLLLQAANDVINRENELLDQLALGKTEYHDTLTIGLPPNRSSHFASEFIPVFMEKYPNMSISIIEKTSSSLPVAVQQNEIDFALVLLSENDMLINPLLFTSIPLETEDLYLVVADSLLKKNFRSQYPACLEKFSQGVLIEDFADFPMFLRPLSSRSHRAIVEYLRQRGKKPYIRIHTTTTSALLPLCAAGYGVFFSPPRLLRYLMEGQGAMFENLRVFPILDFDDKRQLTLIYHNGKYLTNPMRDGIDIIKRSFD